MFSLTFMTEEKKSMCIRTGSTGHKPLHTKWFVVLPGRLMAFVIVIMLIYKDAVAIFISKGAQEVT